MNPKIMIGLRATQGVFMVIVLGTAAYVNNWWTSYWHEMSPSEINFLIFSSIWTILTLLYVTVVPMKFPRAAPPYALLGADCVAMIFWFAGFIALAIFLASRVCFGNVCNAARTATAFSAFEWALFAATTLLSGITALSNRSSPSKSFDHGPMATNPTSI